MNAHSFPHPDHKSGAARSTPPKGAPQTFCPHCDGPAGCDDGLCDGCDNVVDRDTFFAHYPDAEDTSWRPWHDEPINDEPRKRLIVVDWTR